MNDVLSEAIKEAYAVAPAHVVIIHTLEFQQQGVQDAVFISQSRQGIVALDENGLEKSFLPCGFQFTLPGSTEEGFRSLNLTVVNIDRRVTDFVKTSLTQDVPVKAIYRPYLNTDLTQPHWNPPIVFFLENAQISPMQVTARATPMDIVNAKFPNELYDRARFPTLG
jgi:hypothetical protein